MDLTYQLRAGGEILDARAIPTTDTWTFTAFGLPWTDQQWGAQVILELVYRVAGWTGLIVFRAVLIALIFGCLLTIGLRRGLGARRASWLTLAAFIVAAPALALRPQLLGMACFAIVLLLVADRREHPARLWLIPAIVVLWANLHGSFFLGPLVLGLAWLEDVHDKVAGPHRTLLVAVVSAIAACLTPFGPMVWAYAIGLSTNPGRDEPDHGVATDHHPRRDRVALFRIRGGGRDPDRSTWPRDAVAHIAVARHVRLHRRLRRAGPGLVAVGRRLRHRRRPRDRSIGGIRRSPRLDPADTRLIRRLNLVVVGVLALATSPCSRSGGRSNPRPEHRSAS